ncbi:MAG: acyltransferase [Candidatus Lokiarchaeota archaeon]|nr:acyltransferase [Candidatus Lokiarchaeota archaeon]
MRIGYIQTDPVFGDKERNFQRVMEIVDVEAVKADLIVLPELFATGYAFTSRLEAHDLGELPGEETTRFLCRLSRETGAAVAAGFVEVECEQWFNAAMLVDGDRVINTYRKIHLFNKEKMWFAPGDKPFAVHPVRGARVGLMVCYDWMFPEAARSLAMLGADVIAHPANLVMPYCQKAMVTRCLENRVFAVTANRIGTEARGEDKFTFTGGSQITSFNGGVLSSAPTDRVHASFVDIDPHAARDKKINEYNDVISDRRPGLYTTG